jgi:dipeptidyl aminopeptidase/acylaminoacyl peptidase
LNGHYGEYDVDDIRDVARFLIERGEVDTSRVFVRGGSSGGLTALLAAEDQIFAGAIAHYPVTDAQRLNDATHEVEGRYLEELIGTLPESASQFDAVSPHYRTAFPRRVLITHGIDDVVIPVQLVRDYVAKLAASGVDVTYLEFEGEGHGYRSADVQAEVLAAEHNFLRG